MNRLDVLGVALRVSLALAFGLFGYEKVWGTDWVALFQAIGLGDWFRYVTGGLQMLGAVALLVPSTARVGAALIGLTMVGAIAVHLFVLPTGIGGAVIPAAFLGFAIAAGWRRRSDDDAPLSLR
jgi:putative oxidoreductase